MSSTPDYSSEFADATLDLDWGMDQEMDQEMGTVDFTSVTQNLLTDQPGNTVQFLGPQNHESQAGQNLIDGQDDMLMMDQSYAEVSGSLDALPMIYDEEFLRFANIALPDFAAVDGAHLGNAQMAIDFDANFESQVTGFTDSFQGFQTVQSQVREGSLRMLEGSSPQGGQGVLAGSQQQISGVQPTALISQRGSPANSVAGPLGSVFPLARDALTPEQDALRSEGLRIMREMAVNEPEVFSDLITALFMELRAAGSLSSGGQGFGILGIRECVAIIRAAANAQSQDATQQHMAYTATVVEVSGGRGGLVLVPQAQGAPAAPEVGVLRHQETVTEGQAAAASMAAGSGTLEILASVIEQLDLETNLLFQQVLQIPHIMAQEETQQTQPEAQPAPTPVTPPRQTLVAQNAAPRARGPLAARGTQGSPNKPPRRTFTYGVMGLNSEVDTRYARMAPSQPPNEYEFRVLAGPFLINRPVLINRTRYSRKNLDLVLIHDENVRYERNPYFDRSRPYQQEWTRVEMDPETNLPFKSTRAALCPYCSDLTFQTIKNSAYAQHMATNHGILANGTLMPLPYGYGEYPHDDGKFSFDALLKHRLKAVFCPSCHKLIRVNCWTTLAFLANYLRHYKLCGHAGVDIASAVCVEHR